jgi:aarF domain-containing kinase
MSELFTEFNETPLASASLGQVHKARLKSTGEIVAVKVQHKWIKEQVPGDLRIIQIACNAGCWLFPGFKYGWLAEEFRTRLPKELDFVIEASNANRCRQMFKDCEDICVPKIYDEFTRERVLVMSFETGTPVTHVKDLHSQGVNLRQLARLISKSFLHMIFKEGFVHADPHPGNLFVRPNKNGGCQLVILDHGIYTDLTEETRLAYTKLWRGILNQDDEMLKEASEEMGTDFHQLFVAMITNRKYDDVMDEGNKSKMKKRLGDRDSPDAQEELREHALYYHREIVEILDDIKRELLLVLKTNNYLRTIDKRLGNPNNTFNIINNVTWEVYSAEVSKETSLWNYCKEFVRYYMLKAGLYGSYLHFRAR